MGKIETYEIEVDVAPTTRQKKYFRYPPNVMEYDWIIANAPTGSGKTYATIELISRLLESNAIKRVFFAVPTKALTYELYTKMVERFNPRDVARDDRDAEIEGLRPRSLAELLRKKVIVTTYERLEQVLYRLRADELNGTLVVIDEFHNILSSNRSITLLGILTYIAYVRSVRRANVKSILISATFPQLEKFAEWASNYGNVLIVKPTTVVAVERVFKQFAVDIPRTKSITRYAVEKARYLIVDIEAGLSKGEYERDKLFPLYVFVRSKVAADTIAEMFRQHGFKAVSIHSTKSPEEREKIIMELAKPNPDIEVVVGTDIIGQGVNLAINSVAILTFKYFDTAYKQIRYVEPADIRQVIGRAGRPQFGVDKVYAIAVLDSDDYEYEKQVWENAKAEIYGKVRIPRDPLNLYFKLANTKMSLDVWLRYSPLPYLIEEESEFEKLAEDLKKAENILLMIGAAKITESGKVELTDYGKTLALLLVKMEEIAAVHQLVISACRKDQTPIEAAAKAMTLSTIVINMMPPEKEVYKIMERMTGIGDSIDEEFNKEASNGILEGKVLAGASNDISLSSLKTCEVGNLVEPKELLKATGIDPDETLLSQEELFGTLSFMIKFVLAGVRVNGVNEPLIGTSQRLLRVARSVTGSLVYLYADRLLAAAIALTREKAASGMKVKVKSAFMKWLEDSGCLSRAQTKRFVETELAAYLSGQECPRPKPKTTRKGGGHSKERKHRKGGQTSLDFFFRKKKKD